MSAWRERLEQAAAAAQELARRRREGGIRYFEPQPQQIPLFRCTAPGILGIGGNRSGKTVAGGAETAWRLTGTHPYKDTHRPPIKVWACSQDLPGRVRAKGEGEQETHKQLEELRRWIPRDALAGGQWSEAFSPSELTLQLRNGSLVVFKGYDQGLLKFESDAIHFAWFDEEPTDRRIWTSTLTRLVDYGGQWLITATPVLSLQGKGWIEELWEQRADPDRRFEVFQLFTEENPHLDPDALRTLANSLSEEEKAVRLRGAFARIGGRVLSEFDPRRHLVDDFLPPREWRWYLVIDPGWKVAAHLWAAVDARGVVHLFAEHYAREEPIPVRMAVLHEMWRAFGKPDVDVIGDAAAFYRTRQGGTERETPADFEEYVAAAEGIGAEWFIPRPCTKADSYAYRVKRYLQCDQIRVCKGMRWWLWEQERWTRQREREGVLAAERPELDAPIKRHDHLMDCTRYLINELPDPEAPRIERPLPTSVEAHWERLEQSLREKERPPQWI